VVCWMLMVLRKEKAEEGMAVTLGVAWFGLV